MLSQARSWLSTRNLERFADTHYQGCLAEEFSIRWRCISNFTGIGTDDGHRTCDDTKILGQAQLPVRITISTIVLDLLTTRMQIQRQATADFYIRTQIQIATVLAVSKAEQVGD